MIIECLPVEGRRLLLRIQCDGEPWKDIHLSIFGRSPPLPKECSSLEEFTQTFENLEYRLAKIYAIKRLSIQNLPSSELERTLRERLVSSKTIALIVDEFSQLGYLNDQEWAASFVRCQSGRKIGPRAIAAKLAHKGVEKELIEEALETSRGKGEQKESVAHLLATRYRRKNLDDYRERQKVIASLIRRGFDLSVIIEGIKDLKIEIDEY